VLIFKHNVIHPIWNITLANRQEMEMNMGLKAPLAFSPASASACCPAIF
jgi:hypothetical protein